MANQYGLVLFKDYLSSAKGQTNAGPPMSIKAEDLDGNFRRLTPLTVDDNEFFSFTEAGLIPKAIDLEVCIDNQVQTITVIGFVSST